MRKVIEQETLKKYLDYCPVTGVFKWKVKRSNHHGQVGDIAGFMTKHGYLHVKINYETFKLHRLAWLFVYGVMPKRQIDHRDGNRADNRIKNLREATPRQNSRNRSKNVNNTSGRIGVNLRPDDGKWRAYISVDGKRISLGSFNDFEDACKAREVAEIEIGFDPQHGTRESRRSIPDVV